MFKCVSKLSVMGGFHLMLSFWMAFFVGVANAQDTEAERQANQELVKKSCFVIGYNIARGMVQDGVEVDAPSFIEGIQKGLEGVELEMDQEEVQTLMTTFQRYVQKSQTEKLKLAAETNKAEGAAFMAKNAAREGVKKLDNGVQYEVLNSGSGAIPKDSDTVTIHYHGTLPSGEVFDSSVDRKEPAQFPVNRVVPGFSSALKSMKVGDKWRIVIPSDLAYGMQGPGKIGPNRTLVFELELLEIN